MSPEKEPVSLPRYQTYAEYRKKFYGSETEGKSQGQKDEGPASFGRRIVRESGSAGKDDLGG